MAAEGDTVCGHDSKPCIPIYERDGTILERDEMF